MDEERSQAWFDIAREANRLLGLPGARGRFVECVEQAEAEWSRRIDEKQQRQEARSQAVKQTGVPHGAGRLPADPKDGAFHWLEDFHDGTPSLEAWLPADLSPDLDPENSLPLPVPAKREVSLAERYAVLAAVWNARWKGDEKIDPWAGQFCREGHSYAMLVYVAGTTKCDAPAMPQVRLSNEDTAEVQTWIADVEADLTSGASPKDGGWDFDPDQVLSPVKLANRLGIPADDDKTRDALRKRLEKWRKADFDGGWIEVVNTRPREPRYLYPLGKVWPLIQNLKPSG